MKTKFVHAIVIILMVAFAAHESCSRVIENKGDIILKKRGIKTWCLGWMPWRRGSYTVNKPSVNMQTSTQHVSHLTETTKVPENLELSIVNCGSGLGQDTQTPGSSVAIGRQMSKADHRIMYLLAKDSHKFSSKKGISISKDPCGAMYSNAPHSSTQKKNSSGSTSSSIEGEQQGSKYSGSPTPSIQSVGSVGDGRSYVVKAIIENSRERE